jgi:hypothetical protein
VVEVEGLMMDKQIVVDPVAKRAWCKPIGREVGDRRQGRGSQDRPGEA